LLHHPDESAMMPEAAICVLGAKEDRLLHAGCSAAVTAALDGARASHT